MKNPSSHTASKPDLIFVVGNSRSGTTMMGRILALHKEVFTFHELHFFEQLWSAADKQQGISVDDAVMLYAQLLKNQRSGYLSGNDLNPYLGEAKEILCNSKWKYTPHSVFEFFLKNEALLHGKVIPCEQTPRNILYARDIMELFPRAKIIIMVRDPRDVLLSQKRKWKRKFLGASNIPLKESIRSWVNYHPITISKIWKANCLAAKKLAENRTCLLVRFEDLVTSPEAKLGEICSFLGIRYNPDMLAVPKIGSSNDRDNVETGISAAMVGNWNKGGLTKSEIFYCQRICKCEMEAFGYEAVKLKSDPVRIGVDAISFPFKLVMALGLNLSRMKNIRDSIQRRLITQS